MASMHLVCIYIDHAPIVEYSTLLIMPLTKLHNRYTVHAVIQ